MSKTSSTALVDAAFAEFEAPEEEQDSLTPVQPTEEPEAAALPEDGDAPKGEEGAPEDGAEAPVAGDDAGLEGEPGSDLEPEGDLPEDEGPEDQGSAPGAEGIEPGADIEDGMDADDDIDEDVAAVSFASVERELDDLAERQGLNDIPEGVTASANDLVDYLLATGAVIELDVKPVAASEIAAREAAFAAIENSEFFATADDDEDAVDDDAGDGVAPEDGLQDEAEDAPAGEDAPADAPSDELPEPEAEGDDEALNNLQLEGADDLDFEGKAPVEAPTEPEEAPVPEEESEACRATAAAILGAGATQYHPLADQELLAVASVTDVQMVLSEGSDPRWNVIIAGVPAAAIMLSDLPNGQSVRASFCSEDYRQGILNAMGRLGVAQVLGDLHAQVYATEYKTADLAQEIHASAVSELEGEFTNRVVAMRDDFLDRANLSAAAIAKGYFAALPNPVYASAVQVLASRGVLDATTAAAEICATLPDFFAVVAAKATELMDRDPGFVEQLRENVAEAAVMIRPMTAPAEAAAPTVSAATASAVASYLQPSLSARLANPNVVGVSATASTSGKSGDLRSRLVAHVGRLGQPR